ncbi:hypothetical protein NMG60_11008741 [Bertholletia excelsa]
MPEAQEPTTRLETSRGRLLLRKLCRNLFYLHLFLVSILALILTIRGLISVIHNHRFHLQNWFPPLLASTGCAATVGLAWQFFTLYCPSRTIKAAFWLSPLLTCALSILFASIGSPGSLAVAAVALISAIVQSLYACWVSHRFDHAIRILSVSIASPLPKINTVVILTLVVSTLYSSILVVAIGGATATSTPLDPLFIFILLLSLTWTMQVIRNTLQVAASRVKYMNLVCGMNLNATTAFRDVLKHSMGSVCLGSVLVPFIGLVRGSARALSLVSGDTDEFMFSCTDCYYGIASRLIFYGNRWGFVHVGVYNKGILQASLDTWDMFKRVGLIPVVDSDLTSSFCFLCGVVGGAASGLTGGSWALVIHKAYATEVSICAFLIGYFMCRLPMAWPQACVSAYHVAYAENPQSAGFDSTIPVRIQQLQRS